jgi:hypothetical protein
MYAYCSIEDCVCIMLQHYMGFISEFLGALRISIYFSKQDINNPGMSVILMLEIGSCSARRGVYKASKLCCTV